MVSPLNRQLVGGVLSNRFKNASPISKKSERGERMQLVFHRSVSVVKRLRAGEDPQARKEIN